MQRVSFFVSAEQVQGLRNLKTRDGVPVAESLRRAIDAYLAEKRALNLVAGKHATKRRKP